DRGHHLERKIRGPATGRAAPLQRLEGLAHLVVAVRGAVAGGLWVLPVVPDSASVGELRADQTDQTDPTDRSDQTIDTGEYAVHFYAMLKHCSVVVLLACNAVLLSAAEKPLGNWPQFRGPNASGVAIAAKPPVKFGPSNGVLWRIEVPWSPSSPC